MFIRLFSLMKGGLSVKDERETSVWSCVSKLVKMSFINRLLNILYEN